MDGFYNPGPAVLAGVGRPTIEQCRISSEDGPGVQLCAGTDALVQECTVFPPRERRYGAGVVAEPGARGRVVKTLFSPDGVDVLADGANVVMEGNRSEAATALTALEEKYHVNPYGRGRDPRSGGNKTLYVSSAQLDADAGADTDWSEPRDLTGTEVSAQLKQASADMADRPTHCPPMRPRTAPAGGRRAGAWCPCATLSDDRRLDSLRSHPRHSQNVRPIRKGLEPSWREPVTELTAQGHGRVDEPPLSPLSPASTSVASPLTPTRSRLRRTATTSSLSHVRQRLHVSRQKVATHPSVWDHKVVWKKAPVVRMPNRCPGPQKLKVRTFHPDAPPNSSGYHQHATHGHRVHQAWEERRPHGG